MSGGKVWKAGIQRLNLGAFQDLTIAVSHFNWKLISDKHDLDKLTIVSIYLGIAKNFAEPH